MTSRRESILSTHLKTHLRKKFVEDRGWVANVFEEATAEFEKFFALAIQNEGTFLPTTLMIDEVWHECIIETREYAELCESVSPGKFLHHSGIRYDDYALQKSNDDLLSEDLSWLASYCMSFGGFTDATIRYWPFANHLLEKNGWTVAEVNKFGFELVQTFQEKAPSSF